MIYLLINLYLYTYVTFKYYVYMYIIYIIHVIYNIKSDHNLNIITNMKGENP